LFFSHRFVGKLVGLSVGNGASYEENAALARTFSR